MISEELQYAASELGIRLEMVGGIPVWEAHPVVRHQKATLRIQTSIRSIQAQNEMGGACECIFYPDIDIRFPDGSLKRPDISIFCREPDEMESAVTLIPEAVIEIISKGYEAKDLVIGVPFYLLQGVKDVIVFDPYTNLTKHFRSGNVQEFVSPVEIRMECGCVCMV